MTSSDEFVAGMSQAAQAYASVTGAKLAKAPTHPHGYVLGQTMVVLARWSNQTVDQLIKGVDWSKLGRIVMTSQPNLPQTMSVSLTDERRRELVEAYLSILAPRYCVTDAEYAEFWSRYQRSERDYNRAITSAMATLYSLGWVGESE